VGQLEVGSYEGHPWQDWERRQKMSACVVAVGVAQKFTKKRLQKPDNFAIVTQHYSSSH